MIFIELSITDEQANRLIKAFPEFESNVEAARFQEMKRRCGITYNDGRCFMPMEIFLVSEVELMWWWNVAQRVAGIEYVMNEPIAVAVGPSW